MLNICPLEKGGGKKKRKKCKPKQAVRQDLRAALVCRVMPAPGLGHAWLGHQEAWSPAAIGAAGLRGISWGEGGQEEGLETSRTGGHSK